MCTKKAVFIHDACACQQKKTATNMHTLPCKYHAVFFSLFILVAPCRLSMCTLSCFDRQHTDRHHFSRALFAVVVIIVIRLLLLLMERVLFISFWWCIVFLPAHSIIDQLRSGQRQRHKHRVSVLCSIHYKRRHKNIQFLILIFKNTQIGKL